MCQGEHPETTIAQRHGGDKNSVSHVLLSGIGNAPECLPEHGPTKPSTSGISVDKWQLSRSDIIEDSKVTIPSLLRHTLTTWGTVSLRVMDQENENQRTHHSVGPLPIPIVHGSDSNVPPLAHVQTSSCNRNSQNTSFIEICRHGYLQPSMIIAVVANNVCLQPMSNALLPSLTYPPPWGPDGMGVATSEQTRDAHGVLLLTLRLTV